MSTSDGSGPASGRMGAVRRIAADARDRARSGLARMLHAFRRARPAPIVAAVKRIDWRAVRGVPRLVGWWAVVPYGEVLALFGKGPRADGRSSVRRFGQLASAGRPDRSPDRRASRRSLLTVERPHGGGHQRHGQHYQQRRVFEHAHGVPEHGDTKRRPVAGR